MRIIKFIAIHCTATQPNATVQAIQSYWKNSLGWKSPGYHYLIDQYGKINHLQIEDLPTNGVAGYNNVSIHVSYIGGIDQEGKPKDTRTSGQRSSMATLLKELRKRYPDAIIQGHRDFPNIRKACPSFDAKSEYSHI